MSRSTASSVRELIDQGALQVGDGYRTKRAEHGRPGFRIIRVADVMDDVVMLDGSDFVSEEHREQIGSKLGQPGDIVLTTKGTIGRVAVMPELDETVVYSPQLCFFRIIDESALHPRYLRYWFSSPAFKSQASHRMNNTDMAAYINLADIRSLQIYLPPLAVQRAIAEVLGALDDKMAANSSLVRTADELACALTRSSIDLTNTVVLSNVAEITMGSSPPGVSYNEACDGTVFYQGVRDFGMRYPRNRIWTTMPVRLAQKFDTLVSVRAPVGELNLAGEATCIGRGLASVRSTASAPMSLFHLLKDSPHVWAPYEAEGTIFGSINKQQLASVQVPTVREGRRAELERELGALELRIAAALEESDQLAATRDALLPELMSGKIRVRDAEKTVEEVL